MQSEETINQRLKMLIEALNLNPRSFSKRVGVSEGTTRSYIDRGSKPNSEYLSSIALTIEEINAKWLLTGEGTMFTSTAEPSAPYQKNLGGNNNVSQHTGTGAVHQVYGESNSPLQQQLEGAQREIELLKNQLRDKERIIQLLENQLKK